MYPSVVDIPEKRHLLTGLLSFGRYDLRSRNATQEYAWLQD